MEGYFANNGNLRSLLWSVAFDVQGSGVGDVGLKVKARRIQG